MADEVVESYKVPIHWLRRLTAVFLILWAAVLTIVYCVQPDWCAPVTMIPAWCWWVPLLIVIALIRHQSAWILVAWSVFTISCVEEFRSLPRSLVPSQTQANSIRVASVNCNVGNTQAALEALATKPDIVLMQESPGLDHLSASGFQDPAIPMNVVWAGDNSVAVVGNIEPVLADKASHYCHVVATLKDGQKMDVVCLRLSAPVFRLDFWTADFWQDHYNKRQDHRRQLAEIVEHLRKQQRTDTLIIGGDFNCVAGDGALVQTLMNLEDSFVRGGQGWGATGTNDYPLFRVDQIWSSSNLRCLRSRSTKTKHSDHRMVIADFDVDP